jgi:hypothetical protein
LTVALFIEGLLGLEEAVGQPAGVSGQSDASLDRGHAASAQLAVALDERLAPLGQPPGNPHQCVAV